MKGYRETRGSVRARLRDLVTLALEHKKDGVKNYEPGVRIWRSYEDVGGTAKTYEFIFLGEDGYYYRFDARELSNWMPPDRPRRPPYRTREEWNASGSSLTFKDWLDQVPNTEWIKYRIFETVTLPEYIKTKIREAIDLGHIEAIHGIKPVPG